jgi:hypothetical protein
LLAAFFAVGVRRVGSRPALLAIGLLGVLALVIALTHDLSAAHQRGLRLVSGRIASAADTAAFGFYVETAGALLLVLTCVCGFVLIGPPARRRTRAAVVAADPRTTP